MTTLPRRLARLEQAASPGAVIHVWQEPGADAVARRFPEGLPEGTSIVVYSWADRDRAEAPGQ